MIKYALEQRTREIYRKDRMDIKEGCTSEEDMEIIESFETLKEALKELRKYKTDITYFNSVVPFYFVTEYCVEEIEYNEDDEEESPVEFGGIYEYSKMEIEVIDFETKDVIEICDSYADALIAEKNYIGEMGAVIRISGEHW